MIDELIRQAQKGNCDAFEEIILGYKNILYKIAKTRLSNIDDIEDAVQETIISAYQSIYKLRDITKFKSWIITILINKCNRINKKKSKSNVSYEEIDVERYVGKCDVSTSIGFDELISILSKDEKTIMTLFYSEDYTSKEISKILKLNENTVRRKISDARKKLKERLRRLKPMNDIDEKIKKTLSEEQIPPIRFDYKIKNTLNNLKSKKKSNVKILKVCISSVCCSIILLTGVVFAKDIENYIKKLFVNSTEAIDLAVEKDYVQEIDTSYTYDKNVGIKVDRLILDNLYLDISFNIKVNNEEIKTIRFKDFEIKNDNEQIVYQSELKQAETFDKLPIYNTVTWINQPTKINDTEFTDSILLGLKQDVEEFEKLYISVKSLKVIYIGDKEEEINGNWNFCIDINDEMRDSINYKYSLKENNEFIENCVGTISPTGMIIELTVKSPIKFEDFTMDIAEEFYINNNGKQYLPEYIDFSTTGDNKLTFHFNNIGIFTENIDILEFNLGLYNSKIELVKSK